MYSNINNVLTKKGGVGKSLVCAVLSNYFLDRGQRTLSLDLDANQPTFSRYKGLNVERVEVTRNGKVDSRLFDRATETIYGPDAAHGVARTDIDQVVIDSGAGSYLPFVHFLWREGILEELSELGYQHTMHVVLAGGQALQDCAASLNELATHFGADSKIVVWLNGYFDALPWPTIQAFYESELYGSYSHLIDGVVQMPDLDPETEGPAFAQFSKMNLTFTQATQSGDLSYRDSKRLIRIRASYYQQLDAIFGTHAENTLAAEV